jgi:hypothetical protein
VKLEDANQIAAQVKAILERNLGNRLTEDLAQGMYNNVVLSMQSLVDAGAVPTQSSGPDKPTRDTD